MNGNPQPPLLPRSEVGPSPVIPPVGPSNSNSPDVVGWPKGKTPTAPPGFKVQLFASDLRSPRWLYTLPNGDILVSEASGNPVTSANRIQLFRGLKPDGSAQMRTIFAKGLNRNFGMLLLNGWFYVANTDSIVRFPYKTGQTSLGGNGEKILNLPSKGYHGHWTRNIIANPGGTKIMIAVGSASNVAEDGMKDEVRRANILEINPDGSGERVFASGLRNPIGFTYYPGTTTLWAAVNERDELGDELPPDYLTSVKDGGFYGWPYAYWGNHEDPSHKGERPDLVAKTLTPDFALGSHTASLSVDFYEGKTFPGKYRGGAFIAQHGSWNSSAMRGYQVYWVPFKEGKPAGQGETFLGGFIADAKKHQVYGRPVAAKALADGSILVTDDEGGKVWRVVADSK
ncbi:MAG: sorbosone dehydrogenase family protein [Methylotenera sp.]|nr:sorbosone dehydrogenase family protein [Oligoflexia bacterium]